MTRVIVTGAAGFIGANVARRLLDDGLRAVPADAPELRSVAAGRAERRRAPRPGRPGRRRGGRRASWRTSGPTGCSISPRTAAYSWQTDRGRDPSRQRRRHGQPARCVSPIERRDVRQHRIELRVRPQGPSAVRGGVDRAQQHLRDAEGSGHDALPRGGRERRDERQHAAPVLDVRPVGGPESPGSRSRGRGASRHVPTTRRTRHGA